MEYIYIHMYNCNEIFFDLYVKLVPTLYNKKIHLLNRSLTTKLQLNY